MKEPHAPQAAKQQGASKTECDDPEVPAGDSPPKSVGPLVAGVAIWALWVGFLLVMMVVRMRTTAV